MSFADVTSYVEAALRGSLGVIVTPSHFLSLWPQLVALLIALVVLHRRLQARRGTRSLSWRQLLRALFPARIFLHRSARLDYAIFMINQGALFFVTVSAVVTMAFVAETLIGLARPFGFAAASGGTGVAERLAYTLYLVLVWDFGATYAHYLKHKVPVLWEFHKVHHSAEVMTPVTALRRHPIDGLFGSLVTTLLLGLAAAIWALALGGGVHPLTIFGSWLGVYLWRLLGYNLRHSHVWISYGPLWSRILISPAQHQVHHSTDRSHYDTNFGHIFAFWDRMLGTLYVPADRERVTFGIEAGEMADYRGLLGVYFQPFLKAARLMARRPRPPLAASSGPGRLR